MINDIHESRLFNVKCETEYVVADTQIRGEICLTEIVQKSILTLSYKPVPVYVWLHS